MNTLPKAVKRAWVEALRSGKYKQGIGFLHTTRGGYCCLGVLCDISPQYAKVGTRVGERIFYLFDDKTVSETTVSGTLLDWIGQDNVSHLTGKNDNCESFSEIANWIDTNL